jgi:hypothetical protein
MSDRPSWRDIDKKRDGSAHRREEKKPGGGKAPRLESATAAYKKELDRLFKEGGLADKLKDRLPHPEAEEKAPKDPAAGERQRRLRAVLKAPGGPELTKALDELRAHHGLPDDLEILLRALEHPRDEVLREALTFIEQHVEMGDKLPNKKVFVERMKGVEVSSFDPAVQKRAATLVSRLR